MNTLITIILVIVSFIALFTILNMVSIFITNRELSNYRWEDDEKTQSHRAKDQRTGKFVE